MNYIFLLFECFLQILFVLFQAVDHLLQRLHLLFFDVQTCLHISIRILVESMLSQLAFVLERLLLKLFDSTLQNYLFILRYFPS